MLVNSLGYIFECRYDNLGNIGVMESFKVLFSGNIQASTFTCAIDNTGNIIMPANINKSLGLKPLSATCVDEDSLNKFLKSNKPIFGKLGEFAMIASGTITFDCTTNEIISLDKFNFYVPKMVSDNIEGVVDNKGNSVPALVCERVSTTKGLNMFTISEPIYKAYVNNFLACISREILADKKSFMRSIVLRGK